MFVTWYFCYMIITDVYFCISTSEHCWSLVSISSSFLNVCPFYSRYVTRSHLVLMSLQQAGRWGEVNWLFNVTINNISVIHVTAHRCAGGLKKKLDLRSGFQRHRLFVGFFNVPVQAPIRDQPFYTVIPTHRPYFCHHSVSSFYCLNFPQCGVWITY